MSHSASRASSRKNKKKEEEAELLFLQYYKKAKEEERRRKLLSGSLGRTNAYYLTPKEYKELFGHSHPDTKKDTPRSPLNNLHLERAPHGGRSRRNRRRANNKSRKGHKVHKSHRRKHHKGHSHTMRRRLRIKRGGLSSLFQSELLTDYKKALNNSNLGDLLASFKSSGQPNLDSSTMQSIDSSPSITSDYLLRRYCLDLSEDKFDMLLDQIKIETGEGTAFYLYVLLKILSDNSSNDKIKSKAAQMLTEMLLNNGITELRQAETLLTQANNESFNESAYNRIVDLLRRSASKGNGDASILLPQITQKISDNVH